VYHIGISVSSAIRKKRRRKGGIFSDGLFFLFFVLALLIGDPAAGFAGRLAGRLAFAAAAVFGAFAEMSGFDGPNMLHGDFLPYCGSFTLLYHTQAPISSPGGIFLPETAVFSAV
jgi:hypothetical protein